MSASQDRIALAADVPLEAGLALYPRVAAYVGCVKVGLSLFVEHGPKAVEAFRAAGARVFLDLKLHDIPNTVELAAVQAGALGVSFLTVHASGGEAMVRAAVSGARAGAAARERPAPKVLAVTVLTSLGAADLEDIGWSGTAQDTVLRLAELAQNAGADGIVCSPHEARRIRQATGPGFFLCTPGIRPAGAGKGDQARAQTASFAIHAGADLLVVGRPIHGASDPVAAAQALAAEVSAS